ncbi:hypothetical protein Zmor_026288 [Zophobas morio]|uniref:Uncharacterized protein n=1 Tax=Zophobas morio TaxID=2755281 RepID=A0AA38HVQ4_9CUCU|nr:hypothetical protein Zmor_026288 [Zophobas morio]
MLLLRWESNRTFTACRAGALTTRLQRSLSFLVYYYVFTYYCAATAPPPPRHTARSCWAAKERDSCWRRPCYSYVRRSNPGDAADPEHSGHRAVAEGCCVRA